MELQDRLNQILEKHEGAKYTFDDMKDGRRRLRLELADGDVISGTGATTEEAIAAVEERLK